MFGHKHGRHDQHEHPGGHFGFGQMHGGPGHRFGARWSRVTVFDGPARFGPREDDDREEFAPEDDFFEEGAQRMFGRGREWPGGPHHGRDRHDFGFGRGPGRPERLLEQGDLRRLVLDLIASQPRHGYEIIKAIEEMTGGQYAPSPGVIYPTLTFLEETGLIVSEAQSSKKLYTITSEGQSALAENAAAIKTVRDRVEAARGRTGGPPPPEFIRAMNNLRSAIHVRISKGELSAESLAIVTAALDRAAGEIERS